MGTFNAESPLHTYFHMYFCTPMTPKLLYISYVCKYHSIAAGTGLTPRLSMKEFSVSCEPREANITSLTMHTDKVKPAPAPCFGEVPRPLPRSCAQLCPAARTLLQQGLWKRDALSAFNTGNRRARSRL